MTMKQAAVIGAGVMGSAIAAHIANAGIPVFLLDIVPEGAKNRNVIAETAIQKMLKAQPAPFMHKKFAKLVTPGNLEDHLDYLGKADWIVEAVLENLDIKLSLYEKIAKVRKKDSIVSSNTSTIPIAQLTSKMPKDMASQFLITHFFNPPRYMRLLEIVESEQTNPAVTKIVEGICDKVLGKGVVHCKDTPGFIANRIGAFWMQSAVNEAIDLGLSIEEADLVMSRPLGIPKTGIFGLLDLVGIDLMPYIGASLQKNLGKDDLYSQIHRQEPLIKKMIADGYTGRKGKGGFYRLNKSGGKRVKEAINLQTGEYAPAQKAYLASVSASKKGLRALLEHEDNGGQYGWRVLSQLLNYSAALVPEIADDINAVDQAMRLGYNWKFGPFELIDQIGPAWFTQKLEENGIEPAPLLKAVGDGKFYKNENQQPHYFTTQHDYEPVERKEGVLVLSDIKLKSKPVLKNGSASLWDIGDGVACFEFTSKMNSIDDKILELLAKSIEEVQKNFKALVIYNEGTNFSVGANIGLALFAANIAMWSSVEDMVQKGQEVYTALKYSPFPVVGAPSGMALGGGCEILLHCNTIQAHAETYMGLVEVGVGLVPGWGGCKELLGRWANNPKAPRGPMPAASKAFETISMAQVAKSAHEAKNFLFLQDHDQVTMNRDRLLADAKNTALKMAQDFKVPEKYEVSLPGPSGKAAIEMALQGFDLQGKVTPHDKVVADKLGDILSGLDTDLTETLSEEDILKLERDSFNALVRTPATLARMEHILETGKPLRN